MSKIYRSKEESQTGRNKSKIYVKKKKTTLESKYAHVFLALRRPRKVHLEFKTSLAGGCLKNK